jgi:hypothetical protein
LSSRPERSVVEGPAVSHHPATTVGELALLLRHAWLPLSRAFSPLGGSDLPKQKRKTRLKWCLIIAPAGAQARQKMVAQGSGALPIKNKTARGRTRKKCLRLRAAAKRLLTVHRFSQPTEN